MRAGRRLALSVAQCVLNDLLCRCTILAAFLSSSQPSKPITAVDSTHDVTPNARPVGYVLSTYTAYPPSARAAPGPAAAYFIVSHQLTADFSLRVLDLWPPLQLSAVSGAYLAVDWLALQKCAVGQHALASCGVSILPSLNSRTDTVLSLSKYAEGSDPFTPTLTVVVPACAASGAALLGEIQKFATVSVQRFSELSCTPEGLQAAVTGLAAESVTIAGVSAGRAGISVATVTIPGRDGDGPQSVLCTLSASMWSCSRRGIVADHVA
jgi:hypothetical protein